MRRRITGFTLTITLAALASQAASFWISGSVAAEPLGVPAENAVVHTTMLGGECLAQGGQAPEQCLGKAGRVHKVQLLSVRQCGCDVGRAFTLQLQDAEYSVFLSEWFGGGLAFNRGSVRYSVHLTPLQCGSADRSRSIYESFERRGFSPRAARQIAPGATEIPPNTEGDSLERVEGRARWVVSVLTFRDKVCPSSVTLDYDAQGNTAHDFL